MDTKPVKLVIQGFNTVKEAEVFCDWYSGQGEQDARVWFECREDEGLIECSTMDCQSIHVGGPRANTVYMTIKPR